MTEGVRREPAPYKQVADFYRRRIERGELAPGEALMTITEGTEALSVSRGTYVKAMGLLRDEGLVCSSEAGYRVATAEDRRLDPKAIVRDLVKIGIDGHGDSVRCLWCEGSPHEVGCIVARAIEAVEAGRA
jgi:DNA-binding transcriptional MocR family regulator